MNLSESILLDLKAFERRLTEVIACVNPSTIRWRSEYFAEISIHLSNMLPLEGNNTMGIPTLIVIFTLFLIVVLAIMSVVTSVGAYYWLTDPKTAVVPLPESLFNHLVFVLAALILRKYLIDANDCHRGDSQMTFSVDSPYSPASHLCYSFASIIVGSLWDFQSIANIQTISYIYFN